MFSVLNLGSAPEDWVSVWPRVSRGLCAALVRVKRLHPVHLGSYFYFFIFTTTVITTPVFTLSGLYREVSSHAHSNPRPLSLCVAWIWR